MKFLIVAAFVTNIWLTILTFEYPVFFLTFLCFSLFYAYSIFGNSMNMVQNLGPLYWVVRDNGKKGTKVLSIGFMRQLSQPWLRGKGIQFRVSKYTLQIGLCRRQDFLDDTDGVLDAMGGFYMSNTPKEISKWH